MKKSTFKIEIEGDRAWFCLQRSFGKPPDAKDSPLHVLLRWIVEQLCFGHWEPRFDENDHGITLLIGKEATLEFKEPVEQSAEEYARSRLEAVEIGGLFARCREMGVDPRNAGLVEQVRQRARNGSGVRQCADEHGILLRRFVDWVVETNSRKDVCLHGSLHSGTSFASNVRSARGGHPRLSLRSQPFSSRAEPHDSGSSTQGAN